MAGGMTNGVTYFGTVVGSRLPPGIASARTEDGLKMPGRSPAGISSEAPVMAPAFSNWRLVSMTVLPLGVASGPVIMSNVYEFSHVSKRSGGNPLHGNSQ